MQLNHQLLTVSAIFIAMSGISIPGSALSHAACIQQQATGERFAEKSIKPIPTSGAESKPLDKSQPPQELDQQPDEIVPYKAIEGGELKLHIFKPAGLQASDQRPAIVFFFGGGWNGGTPKQFYLQSRYLSSRGMVAICAEYRVKKTHGTTPMECVKDGKSAIRWVRSQAAELGVDPDKIAAGGGSAGGHVAAATALVQAFDEDSDTKISCVPDVLVLYNPVFDNGPEGYGYDRVKDYWQQISPMHNIASGSPPTTIFLGTADRLIPVATAEKYKQQMEAAGCRCDLHLYNGQSHGFFNTGQSLRQTLLETDKFLNSLGFLSGQPTVEEFILIKPKK